MFFWNRSEAPQFDKYGWDESEPPPTSWYVQRIFLFALIVVIGIGIGTVLNGQAMAEKAATALFQPVGLVWLILSLMIYFSVLQRRTIVAAAYFVCWLIITLAGNLFVCNSLASSLESRYYHMNPYEDNDFEYGVLLGGGTNLGPNGQSQLNLSGDRLVVASRMYRAGKVKKIICSGTNPFDNISKGPAGTAFEILQGLGVPANDLIEIPGDNTHEELASLKMWVVKKIEAGDDPGRMALISSAWHLPRVHRLARAQELNVSPVPANFLSRRVGASPHAVIPGVHQILVTSRVVKEYLARIVKR